MFLVLIAPNLNAACVKDRYEIPPEHVAQLKRDADKGGGRTARVLMGAAAISSAITGAFAYGTIELSNKWHEMACPQQDPLTSACKGSGFGEGMCLGGAGFGLTGTVVSVVGAIRQSRTAAPKYTAYETAYQNWIARRNELKELVGAANTHVLQPRLIKFYRDLNDKVGENKLDILDVRLHILLGDDQEELCPAGSPKNFAESIEWLAGKSPVELGDFLALAARYPQGYSQKFHELHVFFSEMKPLAQEIHGHEINVKKLESELRALIQNLDDLERTMAAQKQQIKNISLKVRGETSNLDEARLAMEPDFIVADLDLSKGELADLQDRASKQQTAVETQRAALDDVRSERSAAYVRFNDAAAQFQDNI
jgi:hypothetical protein